MVGTKTFHQGKFDSFQCNWSSSCLNKNLKMLLADSLGRPSCSGKHAHAKGVLQGATDESFSQQKELLH